jgi:hypothetical protein
MQHSEIIMHDSQVRLIAHTPYVLSNAFTMHDIAERSRTAFMSIMKSAAHRFTDADLAEWLKGSYRRATTPASMMMNLPPTHFAIARETSDASVDVLTLQAREEVLEVLRRLTDEKNRDTSFTFDALNSGMIIACRDASGVRGHAPVDAPDLKLWERVLSLVAADYIARPVDYEERLAICDRCEMPYFDGVHACERHDSIAVRRAG